MPSASKKPIIALVLAATLIVALLWLMEASIFPEASDAEVAAAAQIAEIRISTKTGWSLRIFADGSGQFGYGSSAFDFVRIPAGTYDFPVVYRDMRKIAQPEGNIREYEAVSFLRVGAHVATTKYTKEAAVLRPLLETGRLAGEASPGNRLEELWKERPPL